jgi:DNA (cytosine-5)-methyltransferase 1
MFKVVDLFAGPGGLAEGFSAVRDHAGKPVFDIALSVEKEASAFRTLRLRSFVRQFGDSAPLAYYDYIAGRIGRQELSGSHPDAWARACAETLQLELGSSGSDKIIDPLLDRIAAEQSGETILVGGPPCQAYSMAGRARNRGIIGYEARDDHRHFLYREYIRILSRLQPAAFVMENVTGILSAKVDGKGIFQMVQSDLRSAGGFPDSYEIFPLTEDDGRNGSAHVIHSEQYGIPQARHRVILLGIRQDLVRKSAGNSWSGNRLQAVKPVTTTDVLLGMPALRSQLSRTADNADSWRVAAANAFRAAALGCYEEEGDELDVICSELVRYSDRLTSQIDTPPACSTTIALPIRNARLAEWLTDAKLDSLPNHAARSHMESDLARYAFAATFARVVGRSPKAAEFPLALAPEHRNWSSGWFKDRFRVQCWDTPSSTVTSHISKDGHYFIHPDPMQCRTLTVREAARLQTFPDNYFFEGNRTQQYTQVGNAVPPLLAFQVAQVLGRMLEFSALGEGRSPQASSGMSKRASA